jgi:predicted transcriptional regulator
MAIDKKSAAQELFNAGWDQKKIASILELSEKTISEWKKKHRWEEKRAKKNMAHDVAEDTVWELINYQLAALKAKKDRFEEDLRNKKVDDLPALDKGDVDALQKLWTTVKNKQLDWSVIVNNIKDFVGFLSERDIELAKSILTHTDDYLNFKRKNL